MELPRHRPRACPRAPLPHPGSPQCLKASEANNRNICLPDLGEKHNFLDRETGGMSSGMAGSRSSALLPVPPLCAFTHPEEMASSEH